MPGPTLEERLDILCRGLRVALVAPDARERPRLLEGPGLPAAYADLVAEGRDRCVRHADAVPRKAREIGLGRRLPFVRAQ